MSKPFVAGVIFDFPSNTGWLINYDSFSTFWRHFLANCHHEARHGKPENRIWRVDDLLPSEAAQEKQWMCRIVLMVCFARFTHLEVIADTAEVFASANRRSAYRASRANNVVVQICVAINNSQSRDYSKW